MYLRDCLLENVGPLEFIDIALPFNGDRNPKPVVLVGRNGSGKSIFLSHVVDALIEFAKTGYQDIVVGQLTENSYFKVVGGTTQKAGADFGIALLRFQDGASTYCYVDKSGNLSVEEYRDKMGDRFASVASWPLEGNHKAVQIPEDYSKQFFRKSSVCYFPSTRHERPHWLNPGSVRDESVFDLEARYANKLNKPLIVESAAQQNKQWLLDVLLDAKAEVGLYATQDDNPQLYFSITSDQDHLFFFYRARANLESVLKQVVQDNSAQFRLNYRSLGSRLYVQTDSGVIPSLDHLSSGQANLFNLFATIVRYADRTDIDKGTNLQDIEGIVLIDEIEAQAHSDLQYEVLPKLLRMFPKVQFILTSHSPLFLLGMEREYGSDGFEIIDMPDGQNITTERFSEFERSWRVYRETEAFEKELNEALRAGTKPLVLMEGETDPIYVQTALDLLGRADLLDALDVESAGARGPQGSVNTGKDALNRTRNVLEAKPNLYNRRVLLLYDCDANKPSADLGLLSVRTIPENQNNDVTRKGIENLLPPTLFEIERKRFYHLREKTGNYGAKIEEFDKMKFCRWVCEERRLAEDFANFNSVIEILDSILPARPDPAENE